MSEWILENEPRVRLAAFASIFALMALWELAARRRPLRLSKSRRWLENLGLMIVNTAALRVLVPWSAVGASYYAGVRGLGLLPQLELGASAQVVLALLVLDLVIYWQHRIFHRVPLLWRLHRVHHLDQDLDLSSALRFHPVEIALSMGIKIAVVLALGAPMIAVVLFEVVLSGAAMFNHGNVRVPLVIDRALRTVIVTPDMHRVHHSVVPSETNRNYGFNLSAWDHLFHSYQRAPAAGHDDMHIGLPDDQSGTPQSLGRLLLAPFRPG